jgi:hypothetical protein
MAMSKILQQLEDNSSCINPLKCEWAVQETDWLGYWLTLDGIHPWKKKKIKAILQLNSPKNTMQVCSFISAVNHYHDIWPHCVHLLAPLTLLISKGPFEWTSQCQQAFKAIKPLICTDTMLTYPDHNKPFHIYMDASDHESTWLCPFPG